MLHVAGTVRSVGFTMSGQVLLADTRQQPQTLPGMFMATPGTVGGWTNVGKNVYETSGGNVGIGTTFVNGSW